MNRIQEILEDPSVSDWVKNALRTALNRDVIDAAHDSRYLAAILAERLMAYTRPQPSAGTVCPVCHQAFPADYYEHWHDPCPGDI